MSSVSGLPFRSCRAFGVPALLLIGALQVHARAASGASCRAWLAPQSSNFTLEGKITHLAPGKLTINTEENIVFHVRYDDKTEIKHADGSPGSAKDLRVGLKVHVEGDLTESGEIVAAKIELLAESPSKQRSSLLARRASARLLVQTPVVVVVTHLRSRQLFEDLPPFGG